MEHSLYIRAALGQKTERFPIWMMRQAGRYMREYQNIRKHYPLVEMFKTPEIVAKVTLQPITAFGMDAAILFSDILVIPDALGLGLNFIENQGPVFSRPIETMAQIDALDLNCLHERLEYVYTSIRLTQAQLKPLNIPLIGFAGGPFTVASYCVGSGKGHDLNTVLKFYFSQPHLMHRFLDVIADATILYLNRQIMAGVDAIQLFESWMSVLSRELFIELALPYLKKVIEGIQRPSHVPITLFGLANSVFYPLLMDLDIQVIGFDSKAHLPEMRKAIPYQFAIQGHLDPYFLLAPHSILKSQVSKLLDSMQGSSGYIFNLGHGVMPEVPEENVLRVVEQVKAFQNDLETSLCVL